MKKINIVKDNRDFNRIIAKKNQTKNKYFYVYVEKNNLKFCRFGIAIPTKIGIAVVRNKIKRQIKDIIDKSKMNFISNDYIIIVNKNITFIEYDEMKRNLLDLLSLFKKEGE